MVSLGMGTKNGELIDHNTIHVVLHGTNKMMIKALDLNYTVD